MTALPCPVCSACPAGATALQLVRSWSAQGAIVCAKEPDAEVRVVQGLATALHAAYAAGKADQKESERSRWSAALGSRN